MKQQQHDVYHRSDSEAPSEAKPFGPYATSGDVGTSYGPRPDGRHGTRLLISLALFFTTSCIIPLVLRYVLVYVGHYKISIAVAAPSAIFGVFSLVGYLQRSWSLGVKNSTTRPIGGSRWGFDYFHWNFTFGIVFVTTVISIANALTPPQFEVAALPLTILLVQVCGQLVIVQTVALFGVDYKCRISSMAAGTGPLRTALFTIIEDIVAVEGKQGTAWRAQFNERYETSPALRRLLNQLSWMWGISGCAVAALDFVLIFIFRNVADGDVSWAIGWTVPWIFAAVMIIPTVTMTKNARD